ncbi:hypothetical protein PTSG_11384 [Salpingoeca rosetta]|uniref:Uncharacterized protein n=1 Tax=Salpingoeca rosetta (strain ATCC 50818 / BSB-021) TaxID=946362 RepID=F2UT84_SALR5|nr:uncharacterized protein PTSG_11384 [Salpingoeca rosetta]EGD81343.1 hypothetical protein PTSG_11384 [Salpingoeca rosetta]|eukprot:XP_004987620.1 hypothetical protein PTSG_11384 [Salpingoeca rosetta]
MRREHRPLRCHILFLLLVLFSLQALTSCAPAPTQQQLQQQQPQPQHRRSLLSIVADDDDDPADGDYEDDDDDDNGGANAAANTISSIEGIKDGLHGGGRGGAPAAETTSTSTAAATTMGFLDAIAPKVRQNELDASLPRVDVFLIHLRKAGGRTIRCTFSSNGMRPKFSRRLPQPLADVLSAVTRGHSKAWHVRKMYEEAKQERPKDVQLLTTILREPTARVLSAFSTSLGRSSDIHKKKVVKGCAYVGHVHVCGDAVRDLAAGNMTLHQFATSTSTEMAMNYQLQHLSDTYRPLGTLDEEERSRVLRVGLDMLSALDVVLLADRYNESLAILNCWLEEKVGRQLQHINLCSNWNPHTHTQQHTGSRGGTGDVGDGGRGVGDSLGVHHHAAAAAAAAAVAAPRRGDGGRADDAAAVAAAEREEAVRVLRQRNSLDHELYTHALMKFALQRRLYAERQCFKRVLSSLHACTPTPLYMHKSDARLGGRTIEEAVRNVQASDAYSNETSGTTSESIIKVQSCPINHTS